MVMSRKRRNLLSKKRKNGKRNTKRNTKTHKNIRKMRGGASNRYDKSIERFDKWLHGQPGDMNFTIEELNAFNTWLYDKKNGRMRFTTEELENSKIGENKTILDFHEGDNFFEDIPNQKVLNKIIYLINNREFQTIDKQKLQEDHCVQVTTNEQYKTTSDPGKIDYSFKRLSENENRDPNIVYKIDEITTLHQDTDLIRYTNISKAERLLPVLILRDINFPKNTGIRIIHNDRAKYKFTLYKKGQCPELGRRPREEEE